MITKSFQWGGYFFIQHAQIILSVLNLPILLWPKVSGIGLYLSIALRLKEFRLSSTCPLMVYRLYIKEKCIDMSTISYILAKDPPVNWLLSSHPVDCTLSSELRNHILSDILHLCKMIRSYKHFLDACLRSLVTSTLILK